MKFQAAVSLLLAFACSACVSVSSHIYDSNIPHGSHVLNEVVSDEGETRTYVLHSDSDGAPAMHLTVSRTYEIAVMGVHTRSIDRGLANGLGVEPWSGVFLEKIVEGSAAADAGLKPGDVLSKINEQDITNEDQFSDFIAGELVARAEATVTVSRVSEAGGREELILAITLGAREVEDTTTDTTELSSPPAIEKRTGMQLVTVPAELSREIWADATPRTYVCEVVVGSPAYLSGIRRGDRLLSFDGDDVDSTADVVEAIAGESGGHSFEVYGDAGAHDSTLVTVDNLDDRSSFHIPIIVGYSSRPYRTKISVLEFIFQFGFNYDGQYYETDARAPAKKTKLSILPLGMFEFERSQTKSKNTIFWLITWTTRH